MGAAQYLTGQVRADFVDTFADDVISTERQRLNWEDDRLRPLLQWGQKRLRQLYALWADRRGEKRAKALTDKVTAYGFGARMQKLQRHERHTGKRALEQLGRIATLTDEQFERLGNAVLTTWEQGRLRDLIHELAEREHLTEGKLLGILVEANVLAAINTAEAVKAKLQLVHGLRERVERRELENAVRDYIAENPWLISPQWDPYRVERSLGKVITDALEKAEIRGDVYKGRIDLTLFSGRTLLVLEFMRPGKTVDYDHLNRFERYTHTLRAYFQANTGGPTTT